MWGVGYSLHAEIPITEALKYRTGIASGLLSTFLKHARHI
jgi:hypothetical protein